ncbi:PREDICTED: uncharacterized protein LOC104590334 isoform X2 [Nelumbo nucifera]|uniref:Uncharacterized protein LOC104590334 isoform X2 n=1 Tax=Nelumbo nucifera TaxID=4432 RepID=A0A1U7Z8D8_NELNU|nr:PREDICTED: uncharacterized protein LOC104590334 isoform X2 [Nelumbo nucifera]
MATVCQICGVTGFSEFLIYCSKCQISAEHRYCLDKFPAPNEEVIWTCQECISKTAERFLLKSFSSHPLRSRRKKLKHHRAAGSYTNLRKREKDSNDCSEAETYAQRSDVASILQPTEALVKEVVPETLCVVSDSPLSHKENENSHCCGGRSEGGKFKKQRRRLVLNDETNSGEEGAYVEVRSSQVAPDSEVAVAAEGRTSPASLDACHQSFRECPSSGAAQPIIDPIWTGSFNICNENHGAVPCVAHVSSLACSKVTSEAKALPPLLDVKILPKLDVWPPTFCRSPPTDNKIGLYFFPITERDKTKFDRLLYDLIDRELALRAVIGVVELLIFPSLELPPSCRKFLGNYFLWGVFRQRPIPVPHEPGIDSAKSAEGIGCEKRECTKTCTNRESPVGPLSMINNCESDSSSLHSKARICSPESTSSHDSETLYSDKIEKSSDHDWDLEKQPTHGEEIRDKSSCDVKLLQPEAPWQHPLDACQEESINLDTPCLGLFPLEVENIAILSKVDSEGLDLELGLGRSGFKQPKKKSCDFVDLLL